MPTYSAASPLETLLRALCLYLADRGEQLLSLTGITGQKTVRIHLRGLWRRHEAEETGYLYLRDAISELTQDDLNELKELGIEEIKEEEIIINAERLVNSLKTIEEYCGRSLGHLARIYAKRLRG